MFGHPGPCPDARLLISQAWICRVEKRGEKGCFGGAWEGPGGSGKVLEGLGGVLEVPGRESWGVWEEPWRCLGGGPGGAWEEGPGGAWEGCQGACIGPLLDWRLVGVCRLLGTPCCTLASPATGDMPENGRSR